MSKRKPQDHRKKADAVVERRMSFAPLLFLLLALVLTWVGASQFRALWWRLPGPTIGEVDWDAVRDARGRYGGRAREGLIIVVNSNGFTDALHDPGRLDALITTTRQTASMVPHSHLPRLQVAAMALARLERDEVPIEKWWARLEGYLSGLDDAPLDHMMNDLLQAEEETYRRMGLDHGTAVRMALNTTGASHGPLLQFVVSRLDRLAAGVEDDAVAARCMRLATRLVRDWLLEPGPAELKLLAADLLARRLVDENAALAERCRMARATYHARATVRSSLPYLIRAVDHPTPAAAAGFTVAHELGRTIWLAATAVCLLVLGLVGAPLWIARGRGLTWTDCAWAALPGLLLVAAALLMPVVAEGPMLEDLRREGHENTGGPRMAGVAVLATLLVVALVALIPLRRGEQAERYWHRLARAAGVSWLIVSLALVPMVWRADAAHATYQEALAQPTDELFTALGGAEAEALLAEVAAWQP